MTRLMRLMHSTVFSTTLIDSSRNRLQPPYTTT